MDVFVVFPNQLFDDLGQILQVHPQCVYLVEEPIYFFDKDWKPYKPHKMKVAFMRACMKNYFDTHLKKAFPKKCKYIQYADIVNDGYAFLGNNIKHVYCYDPNDVELTQKLNHISKVKHIPFRIFEQQDLLLPKNVLDEYIINKTKTPKHASFYNFVKSKLNILKDVKNMDSLNRSPPPNKCPKIYHFTPSKQKMKYYKEAIRYTYENFSDHYGECDLLFTYPISSQDAQTSFHTFLDKSLMLFGKYEDAVMKDDPFMFHSVISPLMNIGILTPKYVLHKTMEYYSDNKSHIPLSSLEGFLRQVIGWRFFMQSLYIYKADELVSANLPDNKLTFKDRESWYNGNTGLMPIDEEIKKIKQYGYAHHIVRLMVLMNFFILCNVHPLEIYRWFMEVVSMDAYSWVMISNIFAMGFFYPKIMSKPYISTSNYIVKMTDYKKDGHWDKVWDSLYHNFLKTKPSSYTFFYKRTYKDDDVMHKMAETFLKEHFITYKDK